MGGTNTETINGLRLHISNGDVHIHDDKKSLKFKKDQKDFKDCIYEAFDNLDEEDGIYKITAECGSDLNIVKEDKIFSMFLSDNISIKSKLKSFLKGC